MGKLLRLTHKIHNTPHLMAHSQFTEVLEYLHLRNEGLVEMAVAGGRERDARSLAYNPDTRIGLLAIEGPLTYLEYEPMCGAEPTSYQKLESEAAAMLKAGATRLVFDVDSGGGEAYSMMETARNIRRMADEHGAKIYAYVDGMSASAAYGLSVIADEIIANPMAEVGSIGVVVSLANYSEAEKKFGLERSFIFAGDSKVPYDADGKFTEAFLADIQAKVDDLYVSFVSHVAEMRGISEEAVRETQAKVFSANKALELGLIDKVMTRLEFNDYLSDELNNVGTSSMSLSKMFGLKTTSQEVNMEEIVQLQDQLSAATALQAETAEKLAAIEAALAETQAQLSVANAALEEVAKKEHEALEAAKAATAQARKDRLVAALGAEQAEVVYAAIGEMPDAAFDVVVKGYEAKSVQEEDSALFTEVGVGADGEVATDSISLVAQMIANRAKK